MSEPPPTRFSDPSSDCVAGPWHPYVAARERTGVGDALAEAAG